jgi:hypothetical protein
VDLERAHRGSASDARTRDRKAALFWLGSYWEIFATARNKTQAAAAFLAAAYK